MKNIVSREKAEELLDYVKWSFSADMDEENVCRRLNQSITAFDYDAQTLTMEFTDCTWMQNAAGVMHGGMQTVCADTANGTLMSILCDVFGPTISISMNYQRPVPTDKPLVIKSRAVHIGKTTAHMFAELYQKGSDELLATATGIHFVGLEKGLKKQIEASAQGGKQE